MLDAVVNSCAVPFLFRTYRDIEAYRYVDGGLCDNLPVSLLDDRSSGHGPIFAISPFEVDAPPPAFGKVQEPAAASKQLVGYLGALFSAPINHSVNRSRERVHGLNMVDFKTSLGTFDFEQMLQQMEGSQEYGEIYRSAEVKLLNFLRVASAVPADDLHLGYNTNLENLVDRLASVMDSLRTEREIVLERAQTMVYANCLKASRHADADVELDIVRTEIEFRVLSGSVRVLEVALSSGREEVFRNSSVWSLSEKFSGAQLEATLLPVPRSAKAGGALTYLILKNPIVGSDSCPTYILRTAYLARAALGNLKEVGKVDFIADTNANPSAIGALELIAMIPAQHHLPVRSWIEPNSLSSVDISAAEINSGTELSAIGFTAVGMRVKNVPPQLKVVLKLVSLAPGGALPI
jgi:hypothetical protein